jgi:PHD/YefM family antitoxin component YafN of YafNO toxin-antitoxin module
MPLKLTMAQARQRLAYLPTELTQNTYPDMAVITDDLGKPVLAILPRDLYDRLMETLEFLGDSEQMALLRSGLQDVAEGRTDSWETVKANLPLR